MKISMLLLHKCCCCYVCEIVFGLAAGVRSQLSCGRWMLASVERTPLSSFSSSFSYNSRFVQFLWFFYKTCKFYTFQNISSKLPQMWNTENWFNNVLQHKILCTGSSLTFCLVQWNIHRSVEHRTLQYKPNLL